MYHSIGEIIPGVLYVGTEDQAADDDFIREIGLSRILYLSDRPMSLHPDLVLYRHIEVPVPELDAMGMEQVPDIPFKTCVSFVQKSMRAGEKVMVHGMQADVSQSASVAIAFVMQHLERATDDATAYVKARWRVSIPNSMFVPQLRTWGNYLSLKGYNIKVEKVEDKARRPSRQHDVLDPDELVVGKKGKRMRERRASCVSFLTPPPRALAGAAPGPHARQPSTQPRGGSVMRRQSMPFLSGRALSGEGGSGLEGDSTIALRRSPTAAYRLPGDGEDGRGGEDEEDEGEEDYDGGGLGAAAAASAAAAAIATMGGTPREGDGKGRPPEHGASGKQGNGHLARAEETSVPGPVSESGSHYRRKGNVVEADGRAGGRVVGRAGGEGGGEGGGGGGSPINRVRRRSTGSPGRGVDTMHVVERVAALERNLEKTLLKTFEAGQEAKERVDKLEGKVGLALEKTRDERRALLSRVDMVEGGLGELGEKTEQIRGSLLGDSDGIAGGEGGATAVFAKVADLESQLGELAAVVATAAAARGADVDAITRAVRPLEDEMEALRRRFDLVEEGIMREAARRQKVEAELAAQGAVQPVQSASPAPLAAKTKTGRGGETSTTTTRAGAGAAAATDAEEEQEGHAGGAVDLASQVMAAQLHEQQERIEGLGAAVAMLTQQLQRRGDGSGGDGSGGGSDGQKTAATDGEEGSGMVDRVAALEAANAAMRRQLEESGAKVNDLDERLATATEQMAMMEGLLSAVEGMDERVTAVEAGQGLVEEGDAGEGAAAAAAAVAVVVGGTDSPAPDSVVPSARDVSPSVAMRVGVLETKMAELAELAKQQEQQSGRWNQYGTDMEAIRLETESQHQALMGLQRSLDDAVRDQSTVVSSHMANTEMLWEARITAIESWVEGDMGASRRVSRPDVLRSRSGVAGSPTTPVDKEASRREGGADEEAGAASSSALPLGSSPPSRHPAEGPKGDAGGWRIGYGAPGADGTGEGGGGGGRVERAATAAEQSYDRSTGNISGVSMLSAMSRISRTDSPGSGSSGGAPSPYGSPPPRPAGGGAVVDEDHALAGGRIAGGAPASGCAAPAPLANVRLATARSAQGQEQSTAALIKAKDDEIAALRRMLEQARDGDGGSGGSLGSTTGTPGMQGGHAGDAELGLGDQTVESDASSHPSLLAHAHAGHPGDAGKGVPPSSSSLPSPVSTGSPAAGAASRSIISRLALRSPSGTDRCSPSWDVGGTPSGGTPGGTPSRTPIPTAASLVGAPSSAHSSKSSVSSVPSSSDRRARVAAGDARDARGGTVSDAATITTTPAASPRNVLPKRAGCSTENGSSGHLRGPGPLLRPPLRTSRTSGAVTSPPASARSPRASSEASGGEEAVETRADRKGAEGAVATGTRRGRRSRGGPAPRSSAKEVDSRRSSGGGERAMVQGTNRRSTSVNATVRRHSMMPSSAAGRTGKRPTSVGRSRPARASVGASARLATAATAGHPSSTEESTVGAAMRRSTAAMTRHVARVNARHAQRASRTGVAPADKGGGGRRSTSSGTAAATSTASSRSTFSAARSKNLTATYLGRRTGSAGPS